MKQGFFITGTDTDVGKTWVTVALMHYFKAQELSVIGMKPVAAGCEWVDGHLKNDDALLLQQHASVTINYQTINPYAFALPVSPHLACLHNEVSLEVITNAFQHLKTQADVILVEGAGGWLAPLSNTLDISDLAIAIKLPIIVVVAIRLGCINHARLTLQAIQQSEVDCAGWIAVCLDPTMQKSDENIQTIQAKTTVPLLGILPFLEQADFDLLAKQLHF